MEISVLVILLIITGITTGFLFAWRKQRREVASLVPPIAEELMLRAYEAFASPPASESASEGAAEAPTLESRTESLNRTLSRSSTFEERDAALRRTLALLSFFEREDEMDGLIEYSPEGPAKINQCLIRAAAFAPLYASSSGEATFERDVLIAFTYQLSLMQGGPSGASAPGAMSSVGVATSAEQPLVQGLEDFSGAFTDALETKRAEKEKRTTTAAAPKYRLQKISPATLAESAEPLEKASGE